MPKLPRNTTEVSYQGVDDLLVLCESLYLTHQSIKDSSLHSDWFKYQVWDMLGVLTLHASKVAEPMPHQSSNEALNMVAEKRGLSFRADYVFPERKEVAEDGIDND